MPKIQKPKGAMPMQNQTTKASTPNTTLTKKIGNTIYKIQIHFSKSSKETINDKLIRIIKNDIANNAEAS